jgi:hypothetical protein
LGLLDRIEVGGNRAELTRQAQRRRLRRRRHCHRAEHHAQRQRELKTLHSRIPYDLMRP